MAATLRLEASSGVFTTNWLRCHRNIPLACGFQHGDESGSAPPNILNIGYRFVVQSEHISLDCGPLVRVVISTSIGNDHTVKALLQSFAFHFIGTHRLQSGDELSRT